MLIFSYLCMMSKWRTIRDNEHNKWIIETKDHYTCNGETIIRSHMIIIPPTDGDRTDIIGESGNYYYDMTKKQFMRRLTPEAYKCEAGEWTPKAMKDEIAIIIEIKNGEPTLKGK